MLIFNRKSQYFNDLSFVTTAIEKNKLYPERSLIYVDHDNIVAASGKRLHLMKNTPEIEPGAFQIIKKTKSEIILNKCDEHYAPLNYAALIPKDTATQKLPTSKEHHQLAFLHRQIRQDKAINIDHFRDAFLGRPDRWEILVNGFMLLESDTAKAILYLDTIE